MVGNGRDCPVKFAGEERRAVRAALPVQASRRARWASQGNPSGAGAFWHRASSIVGRGGAAPLASSLLALHQNPLRHDASIEVKQGLMHRGGGKAE